MQFRRKSQCMRKGKIDRRHQFEAGRNWSRRAKVALQRLIFRIGSGFRSSLNSSVFSLFLQTLPFSPRKKEKSRQLGNLLPLSRRPPKPDGIKIVSKFGSGMNGFSRKASSSFATSKGEIFLLFLGKTKVSLFFFKSAVSIAV